MSRNNLLLSIKNLSVSFFTEDGTVRAVRDVSFEINKGKTFALVGESGCGKSVTALAIMRLIPVPPGKIETGQVVFDGQDLLDLTEKGMRQVRGNRIAMIFQEPTTSLNPVYTVGGQIAEAIMLHQAKGLDEAWADSIEMLERVGIADPQQRVTEYPHQMSGGMKQRVMIAMSISCQPALLIADEPTTALDVTIQAQILELLDELQRRNQMSILLITHDLSIVAERADDVAVMYASRIVEVADSKTLFAEPLHPYTQGLLKSLPRLGFTEPRLPTISGIVPEPLRFPPGCKFHPRCPIGSADPRCRSEEPRLREVQPNRRVACWYAPGYETEHERHEYESKYGAERRISSQS
jgi:oligopeptide/dipeptide ABC transporter ATP-binding protein